MYREPQGRIDAKALRAWQISGWISAFVYFLIAAAILVLTIRFDWPTWIFSIALLAALGESALEIGVFPRLNYEQWRYEITEDEIELKHGIIFRKRTSIPMVRIQHVDTKQGPVFRRFGLATVMFSTAAGRHEIPALTERAADEVRRQIARLARISNEDI